MTKDGGDLLGSCRKAWGKEGAGQRGLLCNALMFDKEIIFMCITGITGRWNSMNFKWESRGHSMAE